MRLDEPFRYYKVGVRNQRIDDETRPRRERAEIRKRRGVAVVDRDMFARGDILAEFVNKLIRRSAAVAAGRDEQRYIDIRIALAQLREHVRNYLFARDRARVVADYHDGVFLARRQLSQPRRRYRRGHRVEDDFILVGGLAKLLNLRFDELELLFYFKRLTSFPVGNLYLQLVHLLSQAVFSKSRESFRKRASSTAARGSGGWPPRRYPARSCLRRPSSKRRRSRRGCRRRPFRG